jgi:hypothetical protein
VEACCGSSYVLHFLPCLVDIFICIHDTMKHIDNILLFSGGTRVWTQSFVLAKQALWLFWRCGSLKLFTLADLEPWSSWSQPPK